MTKSKKPSKPLPIACPHCSSTDVAFEGVVEVTRAAGKMRAQKVELYTCYACRRQFDPPCGELLRSVRLEAPEIATAPEPEEAAE